MMQAEGLMPMEETRIRYLIDTLRGLGPGWHSRAELAAYLGKNRLNPAETATLDILAATGPLEREMRAVPERPHLNEYVYRIKE
jgi:hypothetical protein